MNNVIEIPVANAPAVQEPANLKTLGKAIKEDMKALIKDAGKVIAEDTAAAYEYAVKFVARVRQYAADIPPSLAEATLLQALEVAFAKAPLAVLIKLAEAIDAALRSVYRGAKVACKSTANTVIWLQNLLVKLCNRTCGTKFRSWEFYGL